MCLVDNHEMQFYCHKKNIAKETKRTNAKTFIKLKTVSLDVRIVNVFVFTVRFECV